MAGNNMEFEVEYEFNGLIYKINATDDIHSLLEDGEYFQNYIATNANSIEMHLQKTNAGNIPETVSFNWSSENTRLLITEYGNRIQKFRNPKMKKKLVWAEIKEVFLKKGYILSEEDLDRKMRNLKHHYKTIKDNNNKKTKTGRGRIVWEFYTLFEEIFVEDRTINYGETLSSLSEPGPSMAKSLKLEDPNPATPTITATTPSTSINNPDKARIEKAAEARGLYRYRSERLKLEERRVAALEQLAAEAKENNRIQRERNEILKNQKCCHN